MTAEVWVSQSEAAKRETAAGRPVTQSSISRFIAGNPDIPVRRSTSGSVQAVEYGALARARQESLGVQDKLFERSQPEAQTPPPVAASVTPIPAGSRKRALEEERLELDLAERKGEVVARAAVQSALETAGVTFVQALERRRRQLASDLMGVTDLRAAELAIKAADRLLLEQLSRDLAKAAEGVELAEPAGDQAAA